ncbi:group III truncated hemoglobin [Cytophagales bacterium LB-30]|uniref:Group III truncated hemoglobin n=1 Tax=Shiella aurantiaca TaxID=3058365 RepID=A0ABT8F3G2_9BACT|nr:group III truncated hemoglobin [Shiella aurantiaca]MDN4165001.1 group III truncated hemoglobin [Shiella aurantiaca]
MKKDILHLDDIKVLVDTFYGKARQDALLGPIFEGVIEDRWPEHLDKMYRFWQTILLEEHTYNGSPFAPHARLPLFEQHFERWLALFHETVEEVFEGEKAEEARWRAEKMAEMFQIKRELIREREEARHGDI